MAIKTEKINVGEFFELAANDFTALNAVKFTGYSQARILGGRRYPTSDEYAAHRLTELSGGLLENRFKTGVGGALSPFAVDIIHDTLDEFQADKSSKVVVILGGHTTAVPTPYWGGWSRNPNELSAVHRAMPANWDAPATFKHWYGHAFGETMCGGSGGSDDIERARFAENMAKVRQLGKQKGLNMEVIGIQSVVGSDLGNGRSGLDSIRDIRYRNFETEEKIGDHEQMCQMVDQLQKDGTLVVGLLCLDQRQGWTLPSESQKGLEVTTEVATQLPGLGWSRWWDQITNTGNKAGLEAYGHREAPIAAALIDCQRSTKQLAAFMLQNELFLGTSRALVDPHDTSMWWTRSYPVVANGFTRRVMNLHGNRRQEFAANMLQLVENLDNSVYRHTGAARIATADASPVSFIAKAGDKFYQVEVESGFRIAFPNTREGIELANTTVRLPASFKNVPAWTRASGSFIGRGLYPTLANPDSFSAWNPNLAIDSYTPASGRDLGYVLR